MSNARDRTASAREVPPSERTTEPIERRVLDERLAWVERGAVLLLIAAASVARVREASSPFGRDFGGHQGAFFAAAAVGYERFGVTRFAGYPALALDGPSVGTDDLVSVHGDDRVLVYVNHPPLVPLIAWCSIALFAPRGWDEAWREHRAPEGVELPERLPFLAASLASLAALWWAARQSYGARVALLALAFMSYLPVSVLYGPLANFEGASLAFACLGLGFHARYARGGRGRDLAAMSACFALGTCVAFAPIFFVVPLALASAFARRWRRAAGVLFACGPAALAPLAAHAWLSRFSGAERDHVLERARAIFEPLVDGSRPLSAWIAAQASHASEQLTIPLLVAAAAGIAWRWRRARPATSTGLHATSSSRMQAIASSPATAIDLATPAAIGSIAYLFAFYRHTLEDQPMFLLHATPCVALGAALALDAIADPLARLRAGLAPLVVATSSLLLPALVRTTDFSLARAGRGPSDDAMLASGPSTPLPETSGMEIAALLGSERLGVHPECAPLNLAAAFYAWRTLTPIRAIEDVDRLRARWPALRDRPASLIVPVRTSPECAVEIVAPAASSIPTESETGRSWRSTELP